VRGTAGMVLAQSPVVLAPGTWYRLVCSREGDSVTITVSRLVAGRAVEADSARAEGDLGSVEFPGRTPLSVGGKLADDGRPAHASDQFNGRLAHVFVNLDAGA
jgi:hypothetical protein